MSSDDLRQLTAFSNERRVNEQTTEGTTNCLDGEVTVSQLIHSRKP